jgi:hypothetical protein
VRSGDPSSNNLFARLFTYVPRPAGDVADPKRARRRNALEDFCTEALAWCLLHSKQFARSLFAASGFRDTGFRADTFSIDTQLSFSGRESSELINDQIRGSRFDLVIKASEPSPAVAVIECKVAPDRRENIDTQIAEYRHHLTGSAFKAYRPKIVLLLTPYSDKHNADAHVSWGEVCRALEMSASSRTGPEAEVLKQFSEFLQLRYLAKMALPPISPVLAEFKKVGPLLAALETTFDSLRNDETVKEIFPRRDALIPNMDWEKQTDRLWYGIWSRGPRPNYYLGLYTSYRGSDGLSMWAQVLVDGDHVSNLPAGHDRKLSRLENDGTSVVFTHPISPSNETSGAIEGWLIDRLHRLEEWADSLVLTS